MSISSLKNCETTHDLVNYLSQGNKKSDDYVTVSADYKGRRVKFNNNESIDNVSIREIIEQFKKVIAHDKAASLPIDAEDVRKILKKIDKFDNMAYIEKNKITNPFARLVLFIRSLFGNIGFHKHKELDVIRKEFLSEMSPEQSMHFKSMNANQLAKLLKKSITSEDRKKLEKLQSAFNLFASTLKEANIEVDESGKFVKSPDNLEKLAAVSQKIQDKMEAAEKEWGDNLELNETINAVEKELKTRPFEELEAFLNEIKSDSSLFFSYAASMIGGNEESAKKLKELPLIKNNPIFKEFLKINRLGIQ